MTNSAKTISVVLQIKGFIRITHIDFFFFSLYFLPGSNCKTEVTEIQEKERNKQVAHSAQGNDDVHCNEENFLLLPLLTGSQAQLAVFSLTQ